MGTAISCIMELDFLLVIYLNFSLGNTTDLVFLKVGITSKLKIRDPEVYRARLETFRF